MVIRVQITDPKLYNKKDSRVHALGVEEYLTKTLNIPLEEVATKTSSDNDLKDKDLMARDSQIRYIITHNALMEGWDCPFAYMLVILDNLTNVRALTQLLGRIMRQPDVKYTGIDDLDRCYVFCIHDDIKKIITLIQKQLVNEGLTDIKNYVQFVDDKQPRKRTNTRRSKFEKLEINLPMVYYKENGKWVDIDYSKHVLYNIKWNDINAKKSSYQSNKIKKDGEAIIDTFTGGYEFIKRNVSGKKPKLFEWVSVISELVPNSWQSARIIQSFWKSTKLPDDKIYANEAELQAILLEDLKEQIINESEIIFTEKLNSNIIKFDIHTSSSKFTMRGEYETLPEEGELLKRRNAKSVQLSLDEPTYNEDFDTDPERTFASYLDDAEAIEWWHRVSAKEQGEYYLRGWKSNKIYPDFIAMFSKKDKRILRIYEIKGSDRDNSDTEYKEKVLGLLQDNLNAGKLSITGGRLEGDFKIVFDDQIGNPLITNLHDGKPGKAKDVKLVKKKK